MAVYTWNTTSGSFNTGANWTPAGPPMSADTASFGAATGTITGTGAVAKLNFQAGGAWSLSGQVQSGTINDLGTVMILSGGVLTATSGSFGVANAAGATGSLVINAGGTVISTLAAQTTANGFTVANAAGSTGSVTVSGSGALLDIGSNPAGIGTAGTGSLTVSAGGTARFASSNSTLIAALSAGNLAGSSASITVSGAGSSVTASGFVYIGRAGTASLTVSGGATFTGGSAASGSTSAYAITIGDGSPATNANPNFAGSGTAVITGSGSTLHSLNQIRVGYRGTTGSLLVDQSAAVQADTNVVVGGGTDRAGGTGTLTVQNGGSVTSGGTHTLGTAGIVFGNDVGTTGAGTVSGSGSVLNANGDRLTVGGNGTGTLTITNGGRAVSGSAAYSDVEAALAVAGATGATGTITISGAGSMLTASGDGVIGGNEKGVGTMTGGAGSVSVVGGGTLSVSGTLTVQAAGTLSVDSASTLTTPQLTINGGSASLAVLSASTAVSFGAGGTLAVSTVSGSNAIFNFTFGDKIDLVGSTAATVSGNVVTTSSGSMTLTAPSADSSYQLIDDGSGGQFVALEPKTIGVYRFFDTKLGTHFYTADANEAQTVLATRSDLTPEGPGGIGLQADSVSASDPNAAPVYRFFDTVYGTHFFTASASERDTIIATRADLTYEPNSSFYEHTTAQPGDTAVYRFFDNVHGTHFYTDNANERAAIIANRPDLVSEGIGFYEPPQNYAAAA